jgi:hypothetical protein
MTKDFIDKLIETLEVKKTVEKSSNSFKKTNAKSFEIAGVQVQNKRIFTEEHRARISEANKHRVISDEHRRKLSELKTGVKLSVETRKKMSEGHKGKVIPQDVVRKIVETRKRNGYTHSEETRRKIGEANKGKVSPRKGKILDLTPEQRRNISEGQKGRVTSEETKQKLRDILSGRKLSAEMKALVIEKRRQPIMTPHGEFKSRQALIDRLVADGVLNATDKLREWFKLYPNAYYYTKKKKVTLAYSVESEREDVLKNDEIIKEFLKIIYDRYKQGQSLFVTEAMKLNSIASPITINRRMTRMIRLNLIERKFDGVNQYRKYLVPTKISIDHLEFNASTQKQDRTRTKSSERTG